jgi:hypothetical protein
MSVDQHRDRGHPVQPIGAKACPDWPSLIPTTVVTFGGTDQPIERLLTLQSAVAKIVHMVSEIPKIRGFLSYDRISGLAVRLTSILKAGPSAPSPRRIVKGQVSTDYPALTLVVEAAAREMSVVGQRRK